jgi:HK97 family phage major capsid protein
MLSTRAADDLASPDQLLEVVYSLKSKYLPGAVWIMPRSIAFKIAQLKDKQGQYIWQQSLNAKQPNTLLGYPVYLCDDMVRSKMPHRILFGNIKEAYQVVDRAQMSLLRDPFSAKPYVEFYATKRVGGEIINHEAVKYIDFTKVEE